jgi:anti-anti-sigma factor
MSEKKGKRERLLLDRKNANRWKIEMTNQKNNSNNIVKNIIRRDDVVILQLVGEIDMYCSTELRGELLEISQNPPAQTIINMSEVDFMDSSGVAVLIEALQLHRRNSGQLKLVGINQRVRSIFEISRLDTIFEIYDSEDEAVSS